MRKLLIASNVLLLVIILLQATSQVSPDKSTMRSSNLPDPCSSRICKDYTHIELPGMINGQLAKSMSEAYARDQGKAYITPGPLGSKVRTPDALSISFELEKIKNLIWKIEHSVCRVGCDTSVKLGIRIYYAKYPSSLGAQSRPQDDLTGLPREYANKHTVFMTGVYKKNNQWIDFDFNKVSSGCKFESIAVSLNKFSFWGLLEGQDNSGDNHGGIAPPPAPGTFPTQQ